MVDADWCLCLTADKSINTRSALLESCQDVSSIVLEIWALPTCRLNRDRLLAMWRQALRQSTLAVLLRLGVRLARKLKLPWFIHHNFINLLNETLKTAVLHQHEEIDRVLEKLDMRCQRRSMTTVLDGWQLAVCADTDSQVNKKRLRQFLSARRPLCIEKRTASSSGKKKTRKRHRTHVERGYNFYNDDTTEEEQETIEKDHRLHNQLPSCSVDYSRFLHLPTVNAAPSLSEPCKKTMGRYFANRATQQIAEQSNPFRNKSITIDKI